MDIVIDDRIVHSRSPDIHYRKAEVLRLLLSLLKIACKYYGILCSPFGTNATAKECATQPIWWWYSMRTTIALCRTDANTTLFVLIGTLPHNLFPNMYTSIIEITRKRLRS